MDLVKQNECDGTYRKNEIHSLLDIVSTYIITITAIRYFIHSVARDVEFIVDIISFKPCPVFFQSFENNILNIR